MLDHTHLALIVLLYPHEPHDVMEIYVGVGPDFGIGVPWNHNSLSPRTNVEYLFLTGHVCGPATAQE